MERTHADKYRVVNMDQNIMASNRVLPVLNSDWPSVQVVFITPPKVIASILVNASIAFRFDATCKVRNCVD